MYLDYKTSYAIAGLVSITVKMKVKSCIVKSFLKNEGKSEKKKYLQVLKSNNKVLKIKR